MATTILGREIVASVLLREFTPQPYLALGFSREWLHDQMNPQYAAVFSGQDVDAYGEILRHWDKHGVVPSLDQFQKSFPAVSYRMPKADYETSELIELATKAVSTYIMGVATVEAQRHVEIGDPFPAVEILADAATAVKALRSHDGGLRLIPMAGIKPRQVRWLWEERIPMGTISVTSGKPGIGKSQFAAWLTAEVTNGTLDGDLHGSPGNVLYVFIEDSLDQTLIPRMMAAGADMSRVFMVETTADRDRSYVPDVIKDLDKIEAAIVRHDIALVVFDPLVAAVKVDRNKSDEVRASLQKLTAMADRTGVAVHGLMHFRKQAADDMLTMIGGSGDWGAVIRAALGFAASADDDDPHTVVSQIKNNLGRGNLDSLRFTIQGVTVGTGMNVVETSRLVWSGVSEWTAQEVSQQKDTGEARTKIDACIDWLTELLSLGPMEKASIIVTDEAENKKPFGDVMLKRAAKKMGMIQERAGFGKGSVWSLPGAERAA
jgi:hypothetical protein